MAYTQSQRGGGSGATGRRRAAILEQINSWVARARWHDEERALELFQKVNEAPERFISPDPDADYREEASRIYRELKEDHGLRTETEAVDHHRDYEAAARRREVDRIDYWGRAEERAKKRAAAPELRPEHSRHYSPAPDPEPRFTRPLPSWVYGLPAPVQSLFATVWILATFDPDRTEHTTA